MAGAPSGSQKICIKCGADCAGKPRVKDASGRYACKSCVAAPGSSPVPDFAALTADDAPEPAAPLAREAPTVLAIAGAWKLASED